MSRLLSFSEVSSLLDCQARWDFRYSDALAGSSLSPKTIAPQLSAGRAWGAAAAAWHIHADRVTAGQDAIEAMDKSLDHDAEAQREHRVFDQEVHDELRTKLLAMLLHYTDITEPFKLEAVEHELLVPIPSRTGVRSSTLYKLLAYVDGIERTADGVWLHEFKLHSTLLDASLHTNSRQIRWYAWAYRQATGEPVVGCWVNERWNEAPKPTRLVKTGRKDGSLRPSHAADQLTTEEQYRATCREYAVRPSDETVEALRRRRWQQRVPVLFRDGELDAAGRELVSAANQIRLFETGELEPIRNVRKTTCGWCPYREICPAPDGDLIEALFERQPPKRDREELYAHTETTEGAAA